MSGLNINTFQNHENEIGAQDRDIALLEDKSRQVSLPSYPANRSGNITELVQGVGSTVNTVIAAECPMLIVANVVNRFLGVISDLCYCHVNIVNAQEETRRVEIDADKHVRIAKEETNREKMRQHEETERLRIQCKSALDLKKQEMESLKLQLKAQETQLNHKHEQLMAYITLVNNNIEEIMRMRQDVLYKMLSEIESISTEKYTTLSDLFIRTGAELPELLKQLRLAADMPAN